MEELERMQPPGSAESGQGYVGEGGPEPPGSAELGQGCVGERGPEPPGRPSRGGAGGERLEVVAGALDRVRAAWLSGPRDAHSLLCPLPQLVAAIVFVSFGVVAAFCCALVDGVFAARHIVSLPPFALRGCRGSDTPAESQPRPRALWRLPPRPADAGSPANVFPRSLQSGPSTRVHVPVREHMRAHTHAHDSQAHTVHHALVCFPHTRARTHTHTHAHVRTQTQAHTHLCAVHAHTAHAYVYTGTLTCYCASVHSGTHSRTHAHVRVSTLTHACVQTPWRTRVHTRALTGLGISAGVPVCSSQL